MAHRIVWAPRALQDFEAVAGYIAQDSPAYANTVVRSIMNQTKTLPAQKEKATNISVDSLYVCRQRPTLPLTFASSTIGPAGLNFRVRDGNGWSPRGKITDKLRRFRGI
jgi:plasmid stabilization system protein ParE